MIYYMMILGNFERIPLFYANFLNYLIKLFVNQIKVLPLHHQIQTTHIPTDLTSLTI